jgi:hypothetical protein
LGAELIPDAEIVQSQFPEVLEELEQSQTRLAELQALFAAADEEDFEDSDETGVMSSEQVKSLKASLKEAKGQRGYVSATQIWATGQSTSIRQNRSSYNCSGISCWKMR